MTRSDVSRTTRLSRRRFVRDIGAVATIAAGTTLAGCQGLPFGPGADAAYYHAFGPTLDIEYDVVMEAAWDAGYSIDEPYYVGTKETNSGFHPTGLSELDERFGPDYLVFGLSFFYRQPIFLQIWFPTNAETTVSVFDDRISGNFDVTSLPPDDWLIPRFTLAFEMGDQQAREYVGALKDQINDGTNIPSVDVAEAPVFPRTYESLAGNATDTTGSETGGDGWYKETFYDREVQFATVDFVVQSMKIIRRRDDHLYTIKIDRLGGFNLTIEPPPQEEIPEDEYRAVFREMFSDIGLPPDVIDDLTFEYTPSVW